MNANNLTYDDIFTSYYTLFRADSDVPASTDAEYTVGMRLANEAINYWSNYDGTYWKELFDTNQVDGSGTQTIATGTTTYSAPTNFREAGGFVKVLDTNGTEQTRYPIIDPQEAQFKDSNSRYCYFTSTPHYYSTGTASQSATTVTGVGTTWTAAMVGMEFIFATGESATITAFTSTTSLTASVSQTVASTTYHIDTLGYKLHLNPAPTSNLNGKFIDYVYYKQPTLFTTGTSRTEMANPYFIVHRMLGMQFRAARNPYYQSAIKDSENTIRVMQLDNNSGSWANPWELADNSGSVWGESYGSH
jgi:hypothetical protein